MAREEERKLEVPPAFVMPDLTGAVPGGATVVGHDPVVLTATYYDTSDLRLARAGATLRHREGDERPWTVKLPSGTPGVREEVSRAGSPTAPPTELVALVTAFTRGDAVSSVVTVRTRRRSYDLCDGDGAVLVEVADDTVSVPGADGFREVEVELGAGDPGLLDRVQAALIAAGAAEGAFAPKHVRALGPAAAAPPDLVPPAPLDPHPRAGDVVARAVGTAVGRIVQHDPLLRLQQPLPDGDTPVHQLRVGCRRLRSDLRTFRPLLDPDWARALRRELRWLSRALAGARDIEVLRDRLHRTAAADPLAPCDPDAVARMDAVLANRRDNAMATLLEAVASPRYHALLDRLVDAAAHPRLTVLATTSARETLPGLVAGPWQELVAGVPAGAGEGDGPAPPVTDATWHEVRVRCKRARYAVEASAEAVGPPARKLARRLARLQELLGAHQDAAVAAHAWLDVAREAARGGFSEDGLAVTAGRLYERERAAVRQVRVELPAVWHATYRRKLLSWLP